jgi:hypothetical protein
MLACLSLAFLMTGCATAVKVSNIIIDEVLTPIFTKDTTEQPPATEEVPQVVTDTEATNETQQVEQPTEPSVPPCIVTNTIVADGSITIDGPGIISSENPIVELQVFDSRGKMMYRFRSWGCDTTNLDRIVFDTVPISAESLKGCKIVIYRYTPTPEKCLPCFEWWHS